MTPFQETRNQFLHQFCPDPNLMLDAIERSKLWTLIDKMPGQYLWGLSP